jgi:hypothetical protein
MHVRLRRDEDLAGSTVLVLMTAWRGGRGS